MRLSSRGPAREIAWGEFHDQYAPIIAAFASRLGADADDVDDLVQEVLKGFFSASPEFVYDPDKGRFRGYLKACVWRKIHDLRARRGREKGTLSLAALPDEAAAETLWNDVWETERLHQALAATRARYAMSPDRMRTFQAFEMCVLLGRTTEQVAAALDLSPESVRAARSRVGRALREEFERLGGSAD